MITIEDISFKGKSAIVRVDFNVPFNENFEITDDSRITAAIPTIQKILDDGGKVILMSHLGRPKDGPSEEFSLKHIVNHLSELVKTKVHFVDNSIGKKVKENVDNLQFGEILLLENLRFYKEEEAGDTRFAEELASLADVYVNDAFGTAHRAHASTAVIAQYAKEKCFGYLMAKEVANAQKLLSNPEKPFTAIVGGAKVSDKILIIQNLLQVADNIIIGGGMAYTFMVAQGGTIGNSLFEENRVETCKEILLEAKKRNVRLILPEDSVIANKFSNDADTKNCPSGDIPEGWMGLDIGPSAIESYSNAILNSKTILWNGPMGVFEMTKFENGTKKIAEAIVQATEKGAFSLIGGGDSSAAVKKFHFTEKVSYVSTGGGALLEFFEGKTLPGVAAILD